MDQTPTATALRNYYNRSDDYLKHLKKRLPENLKAYATALGSVGGTDSQVADLGCGTGISTALITSQSIRAYDIDSSY